MRISLILMIFIVSLNKFSEGGCFGYAPSTITIRYPRKKLEWTLEGQAVGVNAEQIRSFFQTEYPNDRFDITDAFQFMQDCKGGNANGWDYTNTKICLDFGCGYHQASGYFFVRSACHNYSGSCVEKYCDYPYTSCAG